MNHLSSKISKTIASAAALSGNAMAAGCLELGTV